MKSGPSHRCELLLKLPLMHPQQLRNKASRLISSNDSNRTLGRSTSYLKTRIRGSRLLNAARLLVLVELTRRLHQAYEHAYDKQAADQLLPQNPTTPPCNPPTFESISDHPFLGLFPGEFDADAEAFYNGVSDRDRRVLLNTVDAMVDAGSDLTNARFQDFYRSTKTGHVSYGLILTGLNENSLGNLERFRGGYRSPGRISTGSLEVEFNSAGVAHVDVDLHNPNAGLLPLMRHGAEIRRGPTNPNSVTKALARRGVATTIQGCR
jgi:hypothetical protein